MVREHETEPDSVSDAPASQEPQVEPPTMTEVTELRMRELHLNERVDALERELERLRGEAGRYASRVAVLQDRDDRWAERFEKVQLAHDRAASELSALRADARVLIQEREERERLLDEARERATEAEARANAAQDRVVALGNLPIEVEVGLREQIDAARSELHRARLELLAMIAERDDERERVARLKARTQKLANRLEVRDGQVGNLEKRLATARSRVEERNEQLRAMSDSRGYKLLRLSWRLRQRLRNARRGASSGPATKGLPSPSDPSAERALRLVAGQPDPLTQETADPATIERRSS